MTAAMIAQLLLAFGPAAIDLIRQLNQLWSKPELTPEEVDSILAIATKSYDSYINAASK